MKIKAITEITLYGETPDAVKLKKGETAECDDKTARNLVDDGRAEVFTERETESKTKK